MLSYPSASPLPYALPLVFVQPHPPHNLTASTMPDGDPMRSEKARIPQSVNLATLLSRVNRAGEPGYAYSEYEF